MDLVSSERLISLGKGIEPLFTFGLVQQIKLNSKLFAIAETFQSAVFWGIYAVL